MEIYVLRGQEQLGPYTLEEIKDRLSRAQFSPSALAWFAGSPEWIPLGSLPGIQEIASSSRPSVEGGHESAVAPLSRGSADSSALPRSNTPSEVSAPVAASRRSQGPAGTEPESTRPLPPTNRQNGRNGNYIYLCLVVLGVGALVWVLALRSSSRAITIVKPVDTGSRIPPATQGEGFVPNNATPPAVADGKEPVTTPPPTPDANSDSTRPGTDNEAAEEVYTDPEIEAYLKLTPTQREEAQSRMSRAESEKVWLYFFKGRDENDLPIPYTVAERKANALAYSMACKLAMQDFRTLFVRRGESFVTTLPNNDADSTARYMREYKNVTFVVETDRLTEADRMNGWKWHGWVSFRAKLTRTFSGEEKVLHNGGKFRATPWSNSGTFIQMKVDCQSDEWTITITGEAKGFTKPTDNEMGEFDVSSQAPLAILHAPSPPYPFQARVMHAQGSGVCHVVFGATGRVVSAEMTRSTGSNILDKNTVEYAKSNWTGSAKSSVDIPITYKAN